MSKTDLFLFSMLQDNLLEHGMWEVTPEVMEKIWKNSGDLEPPPVERVTDVKDRVSFILYVNGHILTVHTTFNRLTKKFSPYTAISIVISKMINKGSDRIITRFIYRTKNPVNRIKKTIQFVDFMVDELKTNWPLTPNSEWAQLVEVKHEQFYWVDGENKIRKFFAFAKNYPLVYEAERKRSWYHHVARKKKKIKKYRRDIRKKYIKAKK